MVTDFTAPLHATPNPRHLMEVITAACDAALESMAHSQELLLAAARQTTTNLPEAPEVTVPFPGSPELKSPSAQELVDVSFAYADKWLASQKAFAEKYLALTVR